VPFVWNEVSLKYSVLRVLVQHPGARRAMALGQIGQQERAEDEIRKLAARATPELMDGLIALAGSLNLPAAQMRLAQSLGSAQGLVHHAALYPLPRWQPETGFRLDRALIFAVIRAESGFDPDATSHVGALGLMQVMPATARDIARFAALEPPASGALHEPETSISFGQAYLEHLLNRESIGDNLIYLAAAYNAGPSRVVRWEEALEAEDDPLLFLESIPLTETRIYVKKVLANLWTYRARLGQQSSSLQALARSDWPTYDTQDERPVLHARN
jgi:soluble lytic murein transglycosylase